MKRLHFLVSSLLVAAVLLMVSCSVLDLKDQKKESASNALTPQYYGTVLSWGKTATASCEQASATNYATNAVDGNLSTRWAATNSSYPQWLKVDLGASYTLSYVTINWYSSATRGYAYTIDVSTDNSTYNTVVNKTNNTTYGDTVDVVTSTARYVRITVTGTTASGGSASIYELNVFGANSGTRSVKRGVAYDFASSTDLSAISSTIGWWYNWGTTPNSGIPSGYYSTYNMVFIPMLWHSSPSATDTNAVETFILAHSEVQYLLVMNEPNLVDQCDKSPVQAAAAWPEYEAVISDLAGHGRTIYLVGPAMNWGNFTDPTLTNYNNPINYLDAFFSAYQATNGRAAKVDYLAFHWYDYGLEGLLNQLDKYGKQIWVTEMANWNAIVTNEALQAAQMSNMVILCESRSDVFRYAWFTGRQSSDPHFTSLFTSTSGQLSALGQVYTNLPFAVAGSSSSSVISSSSSSSSSVVSSSSSSVAVSSSSSAAASSSSAGGAGLLTIAAAVSQSTNSSNTPLKSFDGSTTTRWESAHSIDPQWIYWDLGSAKNLSQIIIDWNSSAASNYTIQGSADASGWTTLATVVNKSKSDNNYITNSISGSYRYVRMYGTTRNNTSYGYSLYEAYIYGN